MADLELIRNMVAKGNLILQVDVNVLHALYPGHDVKDFMYDRYVIAMVRCVICNNEMVMAWPYYNNDDFKKKVLCYSCGMCEAVIPK